jgi:hypothetical protein
MSDLYERIISERNGYEKVLGRIPGFRGYMDKGSRRAADRMVREYVAGQLKQQINRLAATELQLLTGGGLSYMSATSSAKTKLQTYHDRVLTAMPGYAGLDDPVKVQAEELDHLYAFDEAQIRYADLIKEAIDGLEAAAIANEGIDEAIRALDKATIEANQAFSLREDVILNIGKSMGSPT